MLHFWEIKDAGKYMYQDGCIRRPLRVRFKAVPRLGVADTSAGRQKQTRQNLEPLSFL